MKLSYDVLRYSSMVSLKSAPVFSGNKNNRFSSAEVIYKKRKYKGFIFLDQFKITFTSRWKPNKFEIFK